MKNKIIAEILYENIDESIDELFEKNEGLRTTYCNIIKKKQYNFFKKTIETNKFENIKKKYINNMEINKSKLKEEELKLIKKFLLFTRLKETQEEKINEIKAANDAMNVIKGQTIKDHSEEKQVIINFIKQYDNDFYERFKSQFNLEQSEDQIKFIVQYNNYLKQKGVKKNEY